MASELLVVCTANVCRSPLAAALLRESLAVPGVLGELTISSAGTNARTGDEMCAVAASLLPPVQRPPRAIDHRSRPAERDAVLAAGLVITMEREQRSAISRLAPGSQAKVFTLLEAVALAQLLQQRGGTVAPDTAAVAAALHSVRGLAPLLPVEPKRRWWRAPAEPVDPLTIEDGHGRESEVHLTAARRVRDSADEFAALLRAIVAPAEQPAPDA